MAQSIRFSHTELCRKEGNGLKKKTKATAHVYGKSHWDQQGSTETLAGVRMLWIRESNLDRLWFQMAKRQINSSLNIINV